MKNLDLNALGLTKIETEEAIKISGGGNPWRDLLWMFAKDIAEGYISACETMQEWMVENPDQVQYYRSLHH